MTIFLSMKHGRHASVSWTYPGEFVLAQKGLTKFVLFGASFFQSKKPPEMSAYEGWATLATLSRASLSVRCVIHIVDEMTTFNRGVPYLELENLKSWRYFLKLPGTKKQTLENNKFIIFLFLAVHTSSIGDLVPWLVRPSDPTNNQSLHNTTEWT